jgi:hypothetical protein
MVTLIEVQDIEDTLGRPADDEIEERKWVKYIESVSDFICNYVDVSFEKVEDDVIRRRADYRGRVVLPFAPVHSVTAVVNFRTGDNDFYADWDGINEVFNLAPGQVVDVTYTHGYDTIPRDIRNIAIAGVLGMISAGDPAELRAYQVGDVREDYRDNFFMNLFGDLGLRTLNKYTDTSYTIEVGGDGFYPDYRGQGYLDD